MKEVADLIAQTVARRAAAISRMSELEFAVKSAPGKWSKKEILGHLIDSAQNNVQRMVRAQYEKIPRVVYAQDDWVRLQNYQQYPTDDLIQFWVLINRHFCRILTSMSVGNYIKECDTGSEAAELHSLSFLAEDYLRHMQHHLNQITTEDQ